jgi:hypothetical protein
MRFLDVGGVGSRMKCDLQMIPMGCHEQGRCDGTHLLPYRSR